MALITLHSYISNRHHDAAKGAKSSQPAGVRMFFRSFSSSFYMFRPPLQRSL
jgi:hypothetical protein